MISRCFPPPEASPQNALAGQQAGQYSQPLFGLSFGEELQFPGSAGTQVGLTSQRKGRFGIFLAVKLDLGRKSTFLQQISHCFLALKPLVPTQSPMSHKNMGSSVVAADPLPSRPLSYRNFCCVDVHLCWDTTSTTSICAGLCHTGIEGEVVNNWGLCGNGWEVR